MHFTTRLVSCWLQVLAETINMGMLRPRQWVNDMVRIYKLLLNMFNMPLRHLAVCPKNIKSSSDIESKLLFDYLHLKEKIWYWVVKVFKFVQRVWCYLLGKFPIDLAIFSV